MKWGGPAQKETSFWAVSTEELCVSHMGELLVLTAREVTAEE